MQHAGVLWRSPAKTTAASPLISLPVKQDPVVGGKPPRSPVLSRRSYLSSVRGRRVGDTSSLNTQLSSVQEGLFRLTFMSDHQSLLRETLPCLGSDVLSSVLPTETCPGRPPRRRRPVSPRLLTVPQTGPCFTISVSWCRYQAVYNYLPRNEDELELKEGDVVDVMEKCDDGWFVGECVWSLHPLSVVGGECKSEPGR